MRGSKVTITKFNRLEIGEQFKLSLNGIFLYTKSGEKTFCQHKGIEKTILDEFLDVDVYRIEEE